MYLLMKNEKFSKIDFRTYENKMLEQSELKNNPDITKSAFFNNTTSREKIERRIDILSECLF